MPMRVPLVSICIPAYQGGATIGAAIDSVLAQTFTDFELRVVDDGSTDDTEAQVRARRDPRLRYERNAANLGPQGNWNRCLERAVGTYVKLLPHDDLLHAECLQQQVALLQAQPDLVLCCHARDVIGPDGRVLLRARGLGPTFEGRCTRADIVRRCARAGTNLVGEPGAVLFRRDVAARVGGFDARHPYVIDLDYWLRLLEHGDGWYGHEALCSFRVWRGSWSVALGRQQRRDFQALLHDAQRRAPVALRWADRVGLWWRPAFNAWARQVVYRWCL